MTWRGPDYSPAAEQFGENNKERWFTVGKYIGDIGDFGAYQVKKDGIYYSVWDNDTLIAYSSLADSNNEVDDIWVHENYRKQRIFSMLLFFYKTRLGRSQLMLGSTHSKTMQEVVKGLSLFKKSWKNIRTNEIQPFSLDTLDNFYSHEGKTPWRLILENDGDFSDWPKFAEGTSYIRETYTPYID